MVFGDLKVGKVTLFEMLEPFRQLILRRHKFYVEQASVRLFTQFDNIKEDAYEASDEWLSDLLEQVEHFMDNAAQFPGGGHGLLRVYQI